MTPTRLMLVRRPRTGQQAFGHVKLNQAARLEVERIVKTMYQRVGVLQQIPYDPDDFPAPDEVMVEPVTNIDQKFQPNAPYSLERSVTEIARGGSPQTVSSQELASGGWSFYALNANLSNVGDAILIRATSPTRALKPDNRLLSQFTGGELKPITQPLVGIDYRGDALVVGGTVYILKPQTLESVLTDAEAIKARAPLITQAFASGVSAALSNGTVTWIQTACSKNSIIGRRVERMNRQAALASMTEDKLRAGLKDAKLAANTFGQRGAAIDLASEDHARVLIDIAADLYYQPRFEQGSRRVAVFRRL